MLANIQEFSNSVTDQGVALENNQMLVLNQIAQLEVQMGQAKSDVQTKHDLADAADLNFKIAKNVVDSLEQSVYFAAQKDGIYLAFMSYGNTDAKVGANVYDCYLSFIACYKVGTIEHVYHDEQLVDFPLFNMKLNRTVRGIFVSIKPTNVDAMYDQVLFVGHKPLGF